MQIFRWLMKNPIVVVAVYLLAIVAVIFSMMGGGSSDKDAGVAGSTEAQKVDSNEVDISQAPKIEPSTLTSSLVDGDTTNVEEKPVDVQDGTTTETGEENTVAENDASSEEANNNEEAEASKTKEVEKAQAESKADTAATETVDASTEMAQETKAISEEATETQFTEMSDNELLIMAREAYWNNGLEESAEIYQQLIKARPDVVDYKGELGNVYWRQGFPKKAAELYAEISMPMIEAGKANKVANMVGFIGLFFPEKATEIHNKLQTLK